MVDAIGPGDARAPYPRAPRSLQTLVRSRFEAAIDACGMSSRSASILRIFELLTRESLDVDPGRLSPAWSALNNNGVPFQLAVSSQIGGDGVRFLAEVGAGRTPRERLTLGRERVMRAFDELGFTRQLGSVWELAGELYPHDDEALRALDAGVMWVGAGFARSGRARMSLYFEGRWGELEERWIRTFRSLLQVGAAGAAEQLRDAVRPMIAFAEPLGVAIEVDELGVAALKLYFRTFRSVRFELARVLQSIGLVAAPPALAALQEALLGGGECFAPPAIVYYISISPRLDSISATKVDVCAHCLPLGDRELMARWKRLAERLGLDVSAYLEVVDALAEGDALDDAQRYHSFMGVGVDRDGRIKLNAYLRPAIPARPDAPRVARAAADTATGARATGRAAAYLIENQDPDGAWRDFELPPGASDAWTTAYVGLGLLSAPDAIVPPGRRRALVHAARWLVDRQGEDGGWSYNGACDTDADSTAHAALLLRRLEQRPRVDAAGRLWRFQREDGGFSTYAPSVENGAWGASHADVTPAVIEALRASGAEPDPRLGPALAFLHRSQGADGVWQSYWWSTFLYGTAWNLEVLARQGRAFDRERCRARLLAVPLDATSFELALLLRSLHALDEHGRDAAIVAELHRTQRPDGSWDAAPMLRVTDRRCHAPWQDASPGRLYGDGRRLLTTATVLGALAPLS
jgi:hypothetical protein